MKKNNSTVIKVAGDLLQTSYNTTKVGPPSVRVLETNSPQGTVTVRSGALGVVTGKGVQIVTKELLDSAQGRAPTQVTVKWDTSDGADLLAQFQQNLSSQVAMVGQDVLQDANDARDTRREPASTRQDAADSGRTDSRKNAAMVTVNFLEDGSAVRVPNSYCDGEYMYTWLNGGGNIAATEIYPAFEDTQGHWADNDGSITFAYSHGLFQGVTDHQFAPDESMTRGMLVTVLHRLDGLDAPQGDAPFTDMDPDAFYAEAAAWGSENGIVMGTDGGTFSPERNVTREQFATFLYRYAQYFGVADTTGRASLGSFADAQSVSPYAQEAMEWCVSAGLLQGADGNRLDPQGQATRAQAAAILQRFVAFVNV